MSEAFKRFVSILFACFIGLFIVSSFFLRAKYNYFVYGDKPLLEKQQLITFIALIVVLLILTVIFYRLSLRLNKYSRKIVIPVALAVSFAVQVAIVFAFTPLPEADSQTVLSLALNMLYRHDYSSFQSGGYLYMFPYNFSIVLYLKSLLYLFPDNYLVIKLFNILFTLVTSLMVYMIYKEVGGRSERNDYGVLFLAATYIPALFMNNYIYNDVIATALLTSAIYCAMRFVKSKSLAHAAAAAVLLAIGNYFRSIGVFFLIAVVLYILLSFRRIGTKKAALGLAMMLLLFNLPSWVQNTALQAAHVVDEPATRNSAPVYMWLNMGMNTDTIGFWDNQQSYNIYQREANYNKEISTKLFKQEIVNKLTSTPTGELLAMYYKKMIWTWTEGTYQLDRYGIGVEGSSAAGRRMSAPVMGSYSYETFATELFKGDSKYRDDLLWIVYVMNFLMYCFIAVRTIRGIKARRYDEILLQLIVLGFIGFYLLWEIKSRYIFPVYPLLLVLSYTGFKDTHDWLFQQNFLRNIRLPGRRSRNLRKLIHVSAALAIVLSCSLLLSSCKAITAQNIPDTGSNPAMNGGQWFRGGPGMDGGPGMNGFPGRNGNRGMGGGAMSRP